MRLPHRIEFSDEGRVRVLTRLCWIVLFGLGTALLSGCGGCASSACDPVCSEGEVCSNGQCVLVIATCDGGCPDGQMCQDGICASAPIVTTCRTLDQPCDDTRSDSAEFICWNPDGGQESGLCRHRCDTSGGCPSGSACFFLSLTDERSCEATDACDPGEVCYQGVCRDTICRLSECEGFLRGIETCRTIRSEEAEEGGVACVHYGNQARYCEEAGPQELGADCLPSGEVEVRCQSGLACIDQRCVVACDAEEECLGELACLGIEDGAVDTGVGYCGRTCEPFVVESCGSGETCLPVTADVAACSPAGSGEEFADCSADPFSCRDGLVCGSFQTGQLTTTGRCLPSCDLRVGPAAEDGTVSDLDQIKRDATCPQPSPPAASLDVLHVFESRGAIDVYVGEASDPSIASLDFGERSSLVEGFFSWTGGAVDVVVVPAGAPRSDPPVGRYFWQPVAGGFSQIVLAPDPDRPDRGTLFELDLGALSGGIVTSPSLHVVVAISDSPSLDVVALDPETGAELWSVEAAVAEVSELVYVVPQKVDLVLVPRGQNPMSEPLASLSDVEIPQNGRLELVLYGTFSEDDGEFLRARFYAIGDLLPDGPPELSYSCVPLGGFFGFCQENCSDDPTVYGASACAAEMSCAPNQLPSTREWESLCSPLGGRVENESCDSFTRYASCSEGFYCQEFGNAADGFNPAARGRCASLCLVGGPQPPFASCPDSQACKELDEDYPIGECGFPCVPDRNYSDGACPNGLKTCLPRVLLRRDPMGQGEPIVEDVPSFCDASGTTQAGGLCTGNDCVAGTECMYPRSIQNDFVSSLLSQYFGGGELSPVCRPQCDPFDHELSATVCGAGETCLFNYPWSADVGHCAPIVESVVVGKECSRPGESCGLDSICVVMGGEPVCRRFCEYEGPASATTFRRSTCSARLECAPFVNDIGICRPI
jgi:hypothetical protein